MTRVESTTKGAAIVLDFERHRIRRLAREYVRYYLTYGVECASIWSFEAVPKNEKALFKEFVRREMHKHGFKS